MFDFPNAPTLGQVATTPAGATFTWDGTKWVAGGATTVSIAAGTGIVAAPNPITGSGTVSLSVPVAIANGGTNAVTAGAGADNLHGFAGAGAGLVRRTGAAAYALDSAAYLVSPVNLTSQVTGVLPIANGGTGSSTAAAAPWVEVSGDTMTGALTTASAGIIMPNGAYLWGKDTGGTNRTIAGAYTDNLAYFGDAAIDTKIRGAATVAMNAVTGGKLSLQVGSEELVVINTGGLAIQKAPGHPSLVLHKFTANGYYNKVAGYSQGATRWELNIGDGANETGSNVGSEFTLARFSDAGGYTGTAIMVKRNDGSCWNGTGTWNSFSDIALKRDIEPYTRGLADVIQLEPVMFKYNGKFGTIDDGVQHFGLVAQQAQPYVPEIVTSTTWEPIDEEGQRTGEPAVELLGVDPGRLIYALINAVKELKAEVDALKGGVLA